MADKAQVMAQMSNGLFLDLTEAVQRVTLAVIDTGEIGKVTIVLTVKPGSPGRRMVDTYHTIAESMPKSKAKRAGYFVGADGSWHLNDPQQAEAKIVARPDGQPEFRADNQDRR